MTTTTTHTHVATYGQQAKQTSEKKQKKQQAKAKKNETKRETKSFVLLCCCLHMSECMFTCDGGLMCVDVFCYGHSTCGFCRHWPCGFCRHCVCEVLFGVFWCIVTECVAQCELSESGVVAESPSLSLFFPPFLFFFFLLQQYEGFRAKTRLV